MKRSRLASVTALGLIKVYQGARSGMPSKCRFHPSCSVYAAEAIHVHGAARGSWLAVRRIGRCQPWGGYGFDPVPPASKGSLTTS